MPGGPTRKKKAIFGGRGGVIKSPELNEIDRSKPPPEIPMYPVCVPKSVKEPKFRCDICPKMFPFSSSLALHYTDTHHKILTLKEEHFLDPSQFVKE